MGSRGDRFYYSDLALEQRERFPGDQVEIPGVILEKERCQETGIEKVVVKIETSQGAEAMHKPQGIYITLEGGCIGKTAVSALDKTATAVAEVLLELLDPFYQMKKMHLLVVGLGNASLTADALGSKTVEGLTPSYFWKEQENEEKGGAAGICLSALHPGVKFQTGLETFDIVQGVVNQIKPDVVLVIDSLAARSVARLARTIQFSNVGITPGSGVGNHRKALNQETLGVPVIAVGIPMVIGTPSIARDTLDAILQVLASMEETKSVAKTVESFCETERLGLLRELLSPELQELYVMPKDGDEAVEVLSQVLSEGIMRVVEKG